jgi:hypothetical protein
MKQKPKILYSRPEILGSAVTGNVLLDVTDENGQVSTIKLTKKEARCWGARLVLASHEAGV